MTAEESPIDSAEETGADSKQKSGQESGAPNIVVFSDGTWNQGGAANPTNVWRAFLVTSEKNQIKFHDNGVGSEGMRVSRLIGGAFGYGISRNLRELIAFIIQAYQPGSKIYLFGFSRGAFTVRVLANILCMYGIPTKENLQTTEDVESVAAEMLKCYKREKSRLFASGEAGLNDKRESNTVKFQKDHACYLHNGTLKTNPREDADRPLIHFLGCWDTVDALGVPFEPLKRVAKFYFPLSIRKSNLRPHPKIQTVCHALSLDDERRAFHPLCFDDPGDAAPDQTLHQTWFPGNHCHVGGGYQRDQMAMVPLGWMLQHARNAGLSVNKEQLDDMLSTGFTHGQLPNSRGGMNFFYGYHPRRMDDFQRTGPWSVHISAVERLGEQIQFYLPTGMIVSREKLGSAEKANSNKENQEKSKASEAIRVDIDGIRNPSTLQYTPSLPIQSPVDLEDAAAGYTQYVRLMHQINETNIWVGRVLWYCCLALVLTLIGFGWMSAKSAHETFLLPTNSITGVAFTLEVIAIDSAKIFLPTIVTENFLDGLHNRPGFLTCWTALSLLVLILCRRNRRLVEREAFLAWSDTPIAKIRSRNEEPTKGNSRQEKTAATKEFETSIAGKMVDGVLSFLALNSKWAKPLSDWFFRLILRIAFWIFRTRFVSSLFLVVLVGALVTACIAYLVHSSIYKQMAWANIEAAQPLAISTDAKTIEESGIPKVFDTRQPAFNTGVRVEKGGVYEVTLTVTDKHGAELNSIVGPWEDWLIKASPDGYDNPSDESFVHWFRKYPDYPIFKVLGKVETSGQQVFEIGRKGTFVADADGNLILFVNDVIGFYAINNEGWATVTVQRLEQED